MNASIKAQTLAFLAVANHATVNALSQSHQQLPTEVSDMLHEVERLLNDAQSLVRRVRTTDHQ